MEIKSKIESLLFIASKPVPVKEMAKVLEVKEEEINTALEELKKEYKTGGRGLQIIENQNKYQLVSSSENSEVVKNFSKNEVSGELTKPSLETLTIIAYRGPVSKIELEKIRGVNCSLILRNLLLRGLVEENFDKEKQENYYNVTMDFVRFLGVNSVKELPDYDKLSQSETIEEALSENN